MVDWVALIACFSMRQLLQLFLEFCDGKNQVFELLFIEALFTQTAWKQMLLSLVFKGSQPGG